MDEEMEENSSYIYEDLAYDNCSKMVFINLDGYQSDFNVDMAKYLSKNVMYISFPKESNNKSE